MKSKLPSLIGAAILLFIAVSEPGSDLSFLCLAFSMMIAVVEESDHFDVFVIIAVCTVIAVLYIGVVNFVLPKGGTEITEQWKDPSADPAANGNANLGGGPNR